MLFTLKHVVVIFILQYRLSSSCYYCTDQDYPESGIFISSDGSTNSEDDGYESSGNYYIQYTDGSSKYPEFSSGETPDNDNNYNPEYSLTETPNNDNKYNPTTPDNDNDHKDERSEKHFINFCPEDHSMISNNDIKKLIEENAEILKIQQHFVNSSYSEVEELIKKFKGELNSFLQTLNDRPDHMRHILQDMAGLRQKLEPDVDKIVSQLELFHTIEGDMNEVVEYSNNKLRQLEKFKNLCEMNCVETKIDIRNRFRQYDNNYPDLQSTGTYCIRIADLNKIIHEKLSEQLSQHNDSFHVQVEVSQKCSYIDQKLTEFETNFKKSAVKLFGMTMYNILSLQDDYHHFVEYLNQVNVSSEIYDIRKNIAEIGFRVIELERDLDKYKQYCVNCVVINQRINHNGFGLLDVSTMNNVQELEIPEDKTADIETVVIELIMVKIDEIKESIISNLTAMFDDLGRQLNDSNMFDEYVMKLRPIQDEIENEVKSEQLAFLKLTSLIPKASVNQILELSKKSKQTIQDLESAKQFINQFFSNNWVVD